MKPLLTATHDHHQFVRVVFEDAQMLSAAICQWGTGES